MEVNTQIELFPTGFEIEKISHIKAMSIISKYHYLRGLSVASQNFGAFLNGELIGVVCFAMPISEAGRSMVFGEQYKDHVRELVRLCLVPNCPVKASKIVSASIKSLIRFRRKNNMSDLHALLSFADTGQGHHGGIYQAMSWLYTGESKYKMRKYWDKTGRFRHHRQNGKDVSISDAKSRGWKVLVETSVKHRYIKLLGSKSQKKYFRARLKLDILTYPKPVINNHNNG